MNSFYKSTFLIILLAWAGCSQAQPITGVWRGKVSKGNGLLKQTYKLEVKLIKNGDSLTGTSYYYASANNYARYTVKGVFGTTDNSISWWDDQLIESKSSGFSLGSINKMPLLSTADFNCPGGRTMLLDGKSHPVNSEADYDIHLQKFEQPDFADEWDPVIENFFFGGADPRLIDSVGQIAFHRPVATPAQKTVEEPQKETTVYQPVPQPKPIVKAPAPIKRSEEPVKVLKPVEATASPAAPQPTVKVPIKEPEIVKAPPTIEEKFTQRKIVPAITIPVTGEIMEFKFYDNAEVDGDSISIFLNGKLLQRHIRLTDKAYSIKIAVADLLGENELVMVAENLGAIPPNTAYMEAWSGNQRYSARLESTENSSAMIKLKKE